MRAGAARSATSVPTTSTARATRRRDWSSLASGPAKQKTLSGGRSSGAARETAGPKVLAAIGLERGDVYICNTVKCRPTTPGPRGPKNRAPEPQEMANCRPFLDEQIAIISPQVVLALGAPAAKSFLGNDFQITKMRGRWYPGPSGSALMVSFHPAYVLRQTGGQIDAVKRLVWADLKAVREKLDEPAPPIIEGERQTALFGE